MIISTFPPFLPRSRTQHTSSDIIKFNSWTVITFPMIVIVWKRSKKTRKGRRATLRCEKFLNNSPRLRWSSTKNFTKKFFSLWVTRAKFESFALRLNLSLCFAIGRRERTSSFVLARARWDVCEGIIEELVNFCRIYDLQHSFLRFYRGFP